MAAVAIACTGVYALLFGGQSGCQSTPMTANDRLARFMAQLAFRSKKMEMFGAMSQIVIYVPELRDQWLHCLMG